MDVGGGGGQLHLLVGGGDAAVADVVADGVVEEDGVLRHHADVAPDRRLTHLTDREPTELMIERWIGEDQPPQTSLPVRGVRGLDHHQTGRLAVTPTGWNNPPPQFPPLMTAHDSRQEFRVDQ